MKLHYNRSRKEDLEVFHRMKDMSLAFETKGLEEGDLILEDGSISYTGIKATIQHLDEIAGELHNWYYCNC